MARVRASRIVRVYAAVDRVLADNRIGNEGAAVIAGALRLNTAITSICLRSQKREFRAVVTDARRSDVHETRDAVCA